jgi:hypothetical protein
MRNTISYIATQSAITAIIRGKEYSVNRDNASFNTVRDAIVEQADPDEIAELFNAANAVKKYTAGRVQVVNGSSLFFNGEEIHNTVVDRILEFMQGGLPVDPLIQFLGRLLANPSRRSIEELYPFLEKGNMPITEDGCFLSYKGVRNDYYDVHSGKFLNTPGAVHSMPRREVDDDAREDCSYGFHVGSKEYATHWGPKTVIVKVDPADVVSVPYSDANKLRTCKYEVVCDFIGALEGPLAKSDSPYTIGRDCGWA